MKALIYIFFIVGSMFVFDFIYKILVVRNELEFSYIKDLFTGLTFIAAGYVFLKKFKKM